MKTLGSSQRCWSFYLLIITLDLCLLTLEQLAFYFNAILAHSGMIYGSGIIFSPIKLFPLDKFLNGELFNQMYIFQISQCTSILLPQIISEMSKAM